MGQIDAVKRDGATDDLADYAYSGSYVKSRTYEDIATDVVHTPTYDVFGRLDTLKTTQNTPDYIDFDYTYDKNGNITEQEYVHRTSTPSNDFLYDNLDRLTKAEYLDVSTDHDTFTYDDLGNRLTHNNRAGSDVAYSHNVANEYTKIGPPVSQWKLNETTGTTASDSIGSNGGTLNNFSGTYWVALDPPRELVPTWTNHGVSKLV